MTSPKSESNQAVVSFDEVIARSARATGLVGTSALLAVSGGADSMAMLTALARLARRLALELHVATVDHGLRAESADDAEFVKTHAASLDLPVQVLRIQLPPGTGIEARARAARYAALFDHQRARSLRWVATAHTASDQAETVLMRLARGTALGGAGGIHAARADGVVRPLLQVTRTDVEAYLRALGIPWRHDSMNDAHELTRVRVRREILPVFEAAVPGAADALARFAALAAEDHAHLDAEATAALRRVSWPDGSLEAVAVRSLARSIGRRVLASWLSTHAVEVSARLIDEALTAIEADGTATLPGDRVLTCRSGRVRLEAAPPRARLHATSPSEDGRTSESEL
ncbi:MAG: tRNA lysidine(34) synthetase TilS [Archangium sp.]|nr:tRNA lysidine(34) synthetase TilS [Archangium sp.]